MRTSRDRAILSRQTDRRFGAVQVRGPDPWLNPAWGGDRRLVRRVACRSSAAFRKSQRKRVAVQIANLSTHGCAVRSAERQEVGARCWIILPTLESWTAKVAWAEGALFGLDFSLPLHPAVAELIVRRTGAGFP